MSCEIVDLKEYFFGEGTRDDRRRVETHLGGCTGCREELARLQLTQAALGALRDEEMPRRIAFVSDKVFELRWYQRLWNSGPQLGFVAASLIACAILIHGFVVRPASTPGGPTVASVSHIDQTSVQRDVDSRIAAAVNVAVTKAVAESEARQQQKTVELLNAADHKYKLDHDSMVAVVNGRFDFLQKVMTKEYATNSGLRSGE